MNTNTAARGDADRAHVKLRYRGFDISISASRRFGGILVATTLSGGPDGIARSFGLPSQATDPASACDVTLQELQKVVDDLLAASGNPSGAT